MKLSALNTDRALDVLCELTPYVSSIVSDETIIKLIGTVLNLDGLNAYGVAFGFLGRVSEITPILLKNHRADVYGILSIMNEKSVEDVSDQPVIETLMQIREVFQDEELLRFFKSFKRQEKTVSSMPSVKSPVSV